MNKNVSLPVNEGAKTYLLRLARWAIASHFDSTLPKPEADASLNDACGLFVTLRIKDELRGCIGYIESDQPIGETIVDAARSAAFSDGRFEPLTLPELELISIEISLLTPPCSVASYEDITIGRHGIVLSKGGRRALFLPQVATEQGWDRDTTLRYLCRKAGLAAR